MPTRADQGIPARGKTKPNPPASLLVPLTAHIFSLFHSLLPSPSFFLISCGVPRDFFREHCMHCTYLRLPFPLDATVAIH